MNRTSFTSSTICVVRFPVRKRLKSIWKNNFYYSLKFLVKIINSQNQNALQLPEREKRERSLPWWSRGKESAYNERGAGDMGSISGSGRSPEEGHSNPLQYSCLENLMDRGVWWATVQRVAKFDMTEMN